MLARLGGLAEISGAGKQRLEMLTWTWPASGESVADGWDGTFSQNGENVTVTNASWNGTIAAGGTISLGFNGSDTGQDPSPAAFYLNGNVCSNG
jgi:hypothetical protein